MTDLNENGAGDASSNTPDVDVVVVGAGMAGLYLHKRLRDLGVSAKGFETGGDVGGTWYWNRYPGARCDIESLDYQFTWDPELLDEWTWSERYATQPEILRYMEHVADKHDLRRDIEFDTKVVDATWNDETGLWTIRTAPANDADDGPIATTTCRWYVMATGCLSAPKETDIEGADSFEGGVYVTGRWPHDGVDFTGRRVAVIGTGSSAIQSIPLIADQATELTVLQRTPNFSIPARNGPSSDERIAAFRADVAGYQEEARWSTAGVPREKPELGALMVYDDTRLARYEEAWDDATILSLTGSYNDLLTNPDANATAAEFVRSKIRDKVDDPDVADALCPTTFPIATKRLCLDTGYYETFNRDHVSLVDLRTDAISRITPSGIELESGRQIEVDDIVFATGFDAMTGAIVRVDITGRDGRTLRDDWENGPRTYLGLMTHGFPNLFMITGPQSPSVLSNMIVSIEQHVEWISDAIESLRAAGHDVIEPTPLAQDAWIKHNDDFGNITLFPLANSWYMGANVDGKARTFLPYVGGVDRYRQACIDAVDNGYLGFRRSSTIGAAADTVNDGIIRPLAPDAMVMLELMAEMELPPMHTLPPADARAFMEASAAANPPPPEVASFDDGTYPGADGELEYRRYFPIAADEPGTGALPIVLYFHGGGWVLGHATSDDAFCRDLANRTGSIVVSCDYRHAPEHRFPAAHDDAWAAYRWITAHAAELGGDPNRLVVAGWSAGANLAGHVCQRARIDAPDGTPPIAAQLLVTPVTDHTMSTDSFRENAEGYVLTADLMTYFFDHYADPADRADTRISLLGTDDLSGLPPTVIVTAQFDPLRDEGDAYADAMRNAGTPVTHLRAGGQLHTSLHAVGVLITPAPVREAAFEHVAELVRQQTDQPVGAVSN